MAWPSSAATDTDLYVVVNNLQDFLNGAINAVDVTITLTNATNFPATGGYVSVDQEIIKYAAKSGNQLTGCTRGADGTTAAIHSSLVPVFMYWVADHHNKMKTEVIALETDLLARVGDGSTFNGFQQIQAISGAVNAPGYAFAANRDCGFYLSGSTVAVLSDAQRCAQFTTTFGGKQLLIEDGTLGIPSLSFGSDADSGLFWNAGNRFSVVAGGSLGLEVKNNGSNTQTLFQSTGGGIDLTPPISWVGDENTGFNWSAADNFKVLAGGVTVARFSSSGGNPQLTVPLGSASNPSLSLANSAGATSGLFSIASPVKIGISLSATERFSVEDDTGVAVVRVPDGTSARPGVGFTSDPNTGVYRVSADVLALVAGGAEVLRGNASSQVLHQNGTVSLPTVSGVNDPNTGMYFPGGDVLRFAAGGVNPFTINAATGQVVVEAGHVFVLTNAGSGGSTALQLASDPDTGVYWPNTNELALVAGGADVISLDTVFNARVRIGTSTSRATVGGVANINSTAVGNVGAGEDNLITYSLPANALSSNGKAIKVKAWGTTANNANAKTLKVYWGSVVMLSVALTTGVAGRWVVEFLVIRTGSSTQDWHVNFEEGIATPNGTTNNAIDMGTATETDSGAVTVKCTGTATSDNDVVQEGILVEYIN